MTVCMYRDIHTLQPYSIALRNFANALKIKKINK